jgi:tetratricopeptide (TPR) repeat protein
MVDIVKDDIKSQERRVRKEYDDLIKDADKAYDKEEYQKAKSLYQTALNKLPGEDHPENMLNRIRDIQDAVAEKKAEKLEQQNKYQQKIREADDLLEAGELTAAQSAYLEARNVLPGKSYPSQKLEEIEELKREKKQAAVEKVKAEKENKYNNLIAQADELLDAKSYKKAKENYEKALNVFPDDPYAKNKLVLADRAIRKKIQEEQDRKASFEESVKKGDEYFAAKQYEMAKSEYLKAQDIKPGDPYLSEQVQNVNAELEKIARREEKAKLNKIAYDKAISQGDALVSSGDYQAAIDAYNRAVGIMPGEDLPGRKIDQTNKIILEQKKEQAFETLLAEGQSLIKQAKYEDALEKYQKAARMKPESSVPGKKMEEITSLIQDKKLAQKQREKEEKYQKLVADAEGFLQLDEYAMAKSALNEAIMLKPDDPVAKSKLEEINSELTAIEKEKEERQKLEKSYNEALKLASGYLKENELERSKEALKLALNYKPGDSYAREQLDRVEEKILRMEQEKAQQLAHEQQVQKALAKAEDLLAENKLNEAKNAFLKVLELEPNHQSASNDLKAINEKIAAVQARKMALQAEERKYKQLLENADKLLEKADYQSAKDLYSQAKEMKPDDSYPKNRIKQIDNILETLANAESKKELKKVDASTVTEAKLPKLEFRNNQERDKYLGELLEIFPPGITHEVYKSKKVTTHRYIIIRNNEAHELRSDLHYWGGSDYSRDGKPVTQQYFNSQIKQRKDEYYKKFIK